MTITRKSLADTIDAYDEQIKELNDGKRESFESYRFQLIAAGMGKDEIKAELDAVKAAIRRRRLVIKDANAVEERDALVEEILAEIVAFRAPRTTRVEIIEEFDADTGEIIDTTNAAEASHQAAAAGTPPTPRVPAAPIQPDHIADVGKMVEAKAPSVESVNEPLVTVATDASAGGENVEPRGAYEPPASNMQEMHVAPSNAPPSPTQPTFNSAPHPSCHKPSFCGGFSQLGLCTACKAASGLVPAGAA